MAAVRTEHLAEGVTLYLGDCREILPGLEEADACLTDPPYGINMDRGTRGGGYDGFGKRIKRQPRAYSGDWDDKRPDAEVFSLLLASADIKVIWGGNYFADLLPVSGKWLWWDKVQTMPSFSDGELAWTNLPGNSTKKFVYNGSGLLAKEKQRVHPTQKPVELMSWCLGFAQGAKTILDPFVGSGSTGVAAVREGRSFVGIEIDPAHFDTACRRISDELNRPRLFTEKPPAPVQTSMFAAE